MSTLNQHLSKIIDDIKKSGLFKEEKVITSPQRARVETLDGPMINMCSNNYLGFSAEQDLIDSAKNTLDHYGYGLSSVRFICGTMDIHKELEKQLSLFLGMQDTILYSSCFDANTGLFETLLSSEDAIISDSLNHASIIDGVRLCKAKRFRYGNNDMEDLEAKLKEAEGCRFKLIATDGVFSMDGIIANLPEIVRLKKKYNAILMVDDSHAVGFMGPGGRGTHEHWNVMDDVDIITGTLGKALGGASGGYTSASEQIVTMLRQRSRPYLFSNSLAPMIVGTSLFVLEKLKSGSDQREKLFNHCQYFRRTMEEAGFRCLGADHPIIPILIEDAALAARFSAELLKRGIYATAFSYPVVPQGLARIRTQMSAGLSREQLEEAAGVFIEVGKKLELI